LLLAILAGLFMVRIFIIFHDCGHGSFLKSQRANQVVGFITGLLTFTPYYHWRWEHAIHHAGAGHLDRRGTGDIWTMTVEEYLKSSRWKRFSYRLARNSFDTVWRGPDLFVRHSPADSFIDGKSARTRFRALDESCYSRDGDWDELGVRRSDLTSLSN